ncbi:MAG TPA: hypothetical protein VGM56_19285 [Byssovorax sp.]
MNEPTPAPRARAFGLALSAALGAAAIGCSGGYDAGIDYPDTRVDLDQFVRSPENIKEAPIGFNRFKFGPEACSNVDTHAITQKLGQDDLSRFFEAQGLKVPVKKARANLYWYDVPVDGGDKNKFVRLRLAVLDSQPLAAADLHQSLLEHGPGWWGVRRANLALLAPKASLHEAAEFAVKYKLVCWGMFTYAGYDDAYAVTGPYHEI